MNIEQIKRTYNPDLELTNSGNKDFGHSLANLILRQDKNKVVISKEDKLKQIVLIYNPKKIYNSPKFERYLNRALKEIKKMGISLTDYRKKSAGEKYHIYINLLKENNIPFS